VDDRPLVPDDFAWQRGFAGLPGLEAGDGSAQAPGRSFGRTRRSRAARFLF